MMLAKESSEELKVSSLARAAMHRPKPVQRRKRSGRKSTAPTSPALLTLLQTPETARRGVEISAPWWGT